MTILAQSQFELPDQNIRIFCFNGRKRTLTRKENCQSIYSKNITIDNLGYGTVELGDYFAFPKNFGELVNKNFSDSDSIFKISLAANQKKKLNYTLELVSYSASYILGVKRGKKIRERSVKELRGLSKLEFLDSDRYITTVNMSKNIVVFKLKFEDPWSASVNYTDVLKFLICRQNFPTNLIQHSNSEGCLELI